MDTNDNLIAYCTSVKCSGPVVKKTRKPHAKRLQKWCPDCQSALFWERTKDDESEATILGERPTNIIDES